MTLSCSKRQMARSGYGSPPTARSLPGPGRLSSGERPELGLTCLPVCPALTGGSLAE
jgi:hypothetical protein